MPKTEERLKSPDKDILKSLILKLSQQIMDGADPIELTEREANDADEILRWALTSLDNRTLYHKKRQFGQKHERLLLEQALKAKGGDPEAVKRIARMQEADELVDASKDMDE